MTLSRIPLALAALATAWTAHAAPARADGTVRASCTQGSKQVWREDIPEDAPPERRTLIASRFPDAMCVFLAKADADAVGDSMPSALPADIVAAAANAASLDDDSLAAALTAITGGASAPEIGSVAAISELPTLVADRRVKGRAADKGPRKNLTLTLGVYRDLPVTDVLAHWNNVRQGRPTLSRMTPTVSSANGLTVLNVEGVTDGEAASVCEEAVAGGLGCLAAF